MLQLNLQRGNRRIKRQHLYLSLSWMVYKQHNHAENIRDEIWIEIPSTKVCGFENKPNAIAFYKLQDNIKRLTADDVFMISSFLPINWGAISNMIDSAFYCVLMCHLTLDIYITWKKIMKNAQRRLELESVSLLKTVKISILTKMNGIAFNFALFSLEVFVCVSFFVHFYFILFNLFFVRGCKLVWLIYCSFNLFWLWSKLNEPFSSSIYSYWMSESKKMCAEEANGSVLKSFRCIFRSE